VNWILSSSDHALVTGAKEEEEKKKKAEEAIENMGFEHVRFLPVTDNRELNLASSENVQS